MKSRIDKATNKAITKEQQGERIRRAVAVLRELKSISLSFHERQRLKAKEEQE